MIIGKLGSEDLLENQEGKDIGEKGDIVGSYFKDTVSRLFVCLNFFFNTLCLVMISEYSRFIKPNKSSQNGWYLITGD